MMTQDISSIDPKMTEEPPTIYTIRKLDIIKHKVGAKALCLLVKPIASHWSDVEKLQKSNEAKMDTITITCSLI